MNLERPITDLNEYYPPTLTAEEKLDRKRGLPDSVYTELVEGLRRLKKRLEQAG